MIKPDADPDGRGVKPANIQKKKFVKQCKAKQFEKKNKYGPNISILGTRNLRVRRTSGPPGSGIELHTETLTLRIYQIFTRYLIR